MPESRRLVKSRCCCDITKSCLTICSPMDCSTPGFPVLHYLPDLVMPSKHLILCRPFSSCPQSFPASDSFPWISSSPQVAKVLELQLQRQSSNEYSGLISFRIDWLDLLAVQGTFKSLLQHHSSKASVLRCSAFFMVQLSHLYMTTGKTIALTIWTFVSKVMSLLFSMLSTFVIALLPRSKCLLISWLQSPSAVILEPKKIKSVTVSIVSPSICHEVVGLDAKIFIFWMLNFKLFHSPLSPSSRGSLVPLCFLPLEWYHLHFSGCWYFTQQSWLQLVIHPAWHFA